MKTERYKITAEAAKKLSKATSQSGNYNVYESIRDKAEAGHRKLYVIRRKLSQLDLEDLHAQGFKLRTLKDRSGMITHDVIEW